MCTGVVLCIFKPEAPPVVPNAENYLKGLVETETDWAFCVPAFIEVSVARIAYKTERTHQTVTRNGRVIQERLKS